MCRKWFSFNFFILCIFIYEVKSLRSVYNRDCITPNGDRAKCISIIHCKPFMNVIKTTTKSQKAYMRESHCGNFRNTVVVCCGRHSDYLPGKKRVTRDLNSISPESECGISRVDDRPNGGRITLNREFPWSARLHYNYSKAFSCEGSLISKRYVLTSGLCISQETISRLGTLLSIHLGEHNCRPHEQCEDRHIEVGVESLTVYRDFSSEGYVTRNDIGLVKLEKDIEFNEYISPICLPKPKEATKIGDWVTETGWSLHNKEKLKADLPIISPEECSKAYSATGIQLTDTQICAGGEYDDSCVALSGGSLMGRRIGKPAQWYLEGIVSIGPKQCAVDGLPNIYTQVESYLDWINNNLSQ